MATLTQVPGGSVLLRLQVRKYDGALAVLTGSEISTTLITPGVPDEPAANVVDVDAQTRLVVVSGAQTAARVGKQIAVRVLIALSGSYETVASETKINVIR